MSRAIIQFIILLGTICYIQLLSYAESTAIGRGDDRSGYDRADYRSRSEQLPQGGARADLTAGFAQAPLGLPRLRSDAPPAAMIDLGRRLFFDRRLSVNGTLSCGMCHVPEQGFTQHEVSTPVGVRGGAVKRNAPALYNVAYRPRLFFDGREATLELQVWAPLLADNEMANPSVGAVIERIAAIGDYADAFEAVFGAAPDVMNVGRALAAYQRGLISGDSPFDRWHYAQETGAVTEDVKRGFARFQALGCAGCHLIADRYAHFTDDGYHDTGIGYRATIRSPVVSHVQIAPGVSVGLAVPVDTAPSVADLGRYEATLDPVDRWRYRTPGLRNVAITAPYMHDGSLPTLDAVIDYYAAGGVPHDGQDPRLAPFRIDSGARDDLVAFLRALTGSNVEALAADARSEPIGDY